MKDIVYRDILGARRHNSDLCWVLKDHNPPKCDCNVTERTPEEIKDDVLKSERVQYLLNIMKDGDPKVYEKAADILDEMGHSFNMRSIRAAGLVLAKAFKQLFENIYVNVDILNKVKTACKASPVIFVPCHRSYCDFLLISFVCFHYNLPLPAIASAIDFASMSIVGQVLRESGAFFMQRSFSADILYWNIFSEYVQTHLVGADKPVEFFIEGTRSRTGKSLHPKIGILSTVCEPILKSRVNDITVVPISITYDRIVEEKLYAYELLGIPKPKESTSGLVRATSIFSENFGDVHLHFCEPFSLKEYINNPMSYMSHSTVPRFLPLSGPDDNHDTRSLAFTILRIQQRNLTVSPFSLIAAIALWHFKDGSIRTTAGDFLSELEWLRRVASMAAGSGAVTWPEDMKAAQVVKMQLGIHGNLLRMDEKGPHLVYTGDDIAAFKRAAGPADIPNIAQCAAVLNLSIYRNQMIHILLRPAMVLMAMDRCSVSEEALLNRYATLEQLLWHEFAFERNETKSEFKKSLKLLEDLHCMERKHGNYVVKDGAGSQRLVNFCRSLIAPFLNAYWVVCQHVVGVVEKQPVQKMKADAQKVAVVLMRVGAVSGHDCLSLNVLENGLSMLAHLHALDKIYEKDGTMLYKPKSAIAVKDVMDTIETFVDLSKVDMASVTKDLYLNLSLKSKL